MSRTPTAIDSAEFDAWLNAHDQRITAEALTSAANALLADESAKANPTKASYNRIYAAWLNERAFAELMRL